MEEDRVDSDRGDVVSDEVEYHFSEQGFDLTDKVGSCWMGGGWFF